MSRMYRLNTLHRFLAFMLALLVFVTSTGFSVDTHYCQGHMKTFNVFGKAKTCSDLEKATVCGHQDENTNGGTVGKRPCCENRFRYFQPDQSRISQSTNSVSVKPVQVYMPVSVFVTSHFNIIDLEAPAFSRYKPPPLLRDIPVLTQVFRL